jgi:uncharacterized membrane protein
MLNHLFNLVLYKTKLKYNLKMDSSQNLDVKTQENVQNAVNIAVQQVQQSMRYHETKLNNKSYVINFKDLPLIKQLPDIMQEFFKMLSSSFLAFFLFSQFFSFITGWNPIYFLISIGLINSFYLTKLKMMLDKNPEYKAPGCKCGTTKYSNMEIILKHKTSSLFFNIPNSVFGMIFYIVLFYLTYYQEKTSFVVLTIAGGIMNIFLSKILLFEIKSLCNICCSIYIVDLLILIYTVY